MERPVLSVLMPNYNHSKYIGEALQAILNQSYRPDEIIIIDDASTDNSVEIIRGFVEQNPIVRLIVNENNTGVENNLNKLLELAKGDYLFFAAADDKILPGFFERSMDLLKQYPQAGLCSTMSLIIDEAGRNMGLDPSVFVISKEACFISPKKVFSTLNKISGSWMAGNAAIWKRSALMDSGGFKNELHAFSDGFVRQVIALKCGVCFIPEVLACWRRMRGGYSSAMGLRPDSTKEITENAAKLMRTVYKDLFPIEYVDDFERSQLFFAELNFFVMKQEEKKDIMRQYYRDKPVLKYPVFIARGLEQKLIKISYAFYLLVRYRPRIFPLLLRTINRYYYSIFYSAKRIGI